MNKDSKASLIKWANFRFSIIGALLARPPEKGQLCKEIEKIAQQHYCHPIKGIQVKFGISTIERWYYKALNSDDPILALMRKPRSDIGQSKAINPAMFTILANQYKLYPNWSYKLHADNLKAAIYEKPEFE